jgi:hypothetical protein
MAAAGGSELVTGWKRSTTCRVRGGVGGFEQLTETRSPSLKSVHRADPWRAELKPPGDGFGFTVALTSLAGSRPRASISYSSCPTDYGAHTQIAQSVHAVTPVGPNTSSKRGTTWEASYERGLPGLKAGRVECCGSGGHTVGHP